MLLSHVRDAAAYRRHDTREKDRRAVDDRRMDVRLRREDGAIGAAGFLQHLVRLG